MSGALCALPSRVRWRLGSLTVAASARSGGGARARASAGMAAVNTPGLSLFIFNRICRVYQPEPRLPVPHESRGDAI